ncbi:MAG: exo-alpha-sialidase [Terrabacter sp.]|nr:exo-alpha-sialidase [Terrabacter sp.]
MAHRRVLTACIVSVATALAGAAVAVAAPTDVIVNVASPPTPFSQNKQNEPAVAIDAHDPSVVVAGANDEIDDESCAAGDPTTCPFTDGVGVSGVYFSFNGGSRWTQPTYTGLTGRDCLGPAACTAHPGPIGTLPGYAAKGLVSDGDPAVAFGPRPASDGRFSWTNGSRLYYANLTSNVSADKESATFKGFEAIAVSRTDDPRAAAADDATAWKAPVIISKQSSTTFSDKEQVWADNAESSRFFGHVYVCWASFRSNSHGNALPTPLIVARSTDGGDSWTTKQVGPATDNGINGQPDGCTVRTDSHGNVYVFGVGRRRGADLQLMYRSTDGGAHWAGPTAVAPVTEPGVLDPVLGRPTMDGRRHRQRGPERRRSHQPDRHDLGRRCLGARPRAAALDELHHGGRQLDRSGRARAAGGGPTRLHGAGAVARRHRPLRRRQRLHDALPARHDVGPRSRRPGLARQRRGGGAERVVVTGPQRRR